MRGERALETTAGDGGGGGPIKATKGEGPSCCPSAPPGLGPGVGGTLSLCFILVRVREAVWPLCVVVCVGLWGGGEWRVVRIKEA